MSRIAQIASSWTIPFSTSAGSRRRSRSTVGSSRSASPSARACAVSRVAARASAALVATQRRAGRLSQAANAAFRRLRASWTASAGRVTDGWWYATNWGQKQRSHPWADRSQDKSCSSPRKCNILLNPPTASKASLRTTAEQARNPRIDGPGNAGSRPRGLSASAAVSGSSHCDGHTTVRAANSATVGCRSNTVSAIDGAWGSHQESSSQNATNGVWQCATPTFRPTAPRFSERATTLRRAPERADNLSSAATESSTDALSTTTIGKFVVSSSRATVAASSPERSRLAMTNDVRGSMDMTGSSTRQASFQTGLRTRPEADRPPAHQLSRVLVTGGGGFLGGHLCRALLEGGAEVLCVDDLSTNAPAGRLDGQPGYQFLRHDISEPLPPEWRDTLFDTVFHLASPASPIDYLRLPTATLRAGASGTEVALGIAELSGGRFVLASTSEVYGDPLQHPQREDYWGNVNPIGPRSVYDEAKRYAEALTFAYRRERQMSVGVARIFNTYGPHMRADDGRAVPTFCRQALNGEPMTVSGNGDQTRSLCYVDDTITGLLSLAVSDFEGPVNIGNPEELTVLRIAELIRDLAGSDSPIEFTPAVTDDPRRRCPDITRAQDRLGWAPVISYTKGLAATVDWFRANSDESSHTSTRDR